ncbi:MAG: peptide ABC transporter substrate-binding protein [Verrucomicrobia bacterium]|jgi:oligopeptide transport system substrate-binding protein|nr:peptide ABC transporter substrate-binding protein [Verrucomicrobiota bacterium]MBT3842489.1 peptide ABC transporter substrate-binding protein [Verrucomicrobiota bacterium]MBT4901775.1 peptide ABC transporter substrate-binding protein [Verrucomicrobiota bacterium]MBT5311856.1 peptide ABC transporter substrate-binding protein [Verrucomicrobiota bacterium]MBT6104340.1 peptide ABC transporter substrate-binding protein [Verrucomicrobiota bacterium]
MIFKSVPVQRLGTLFLCLGLLAQTGCFQQHEPADFVVINGPDPESLDPAIITSQADGRIVSALFEGLTRFNAITAQAEPALAKRWDISGDGIVYTFHLRDGLQWSTGEPITARDVVYSWRRAVDPATASDYAGMLFYVKNAESINAGKTADLSQLGVQAIDAKTVRVVLTAPTPFFLELCAFWTLAVVPEKAISRHGDQWCLRQPLSVSGSHTLEFWHVRDRVRLRNNPLYWDASNTRNNVVDLLPVESPATAINLFEAGQADVIWDKSLVPTELLDALSQRPEFHKFDYLGSYFVRFNTTKKPLDDPRVRKAMALAIDKARVVAKYTKGGERPAEHFVPPGTGNYTSPSGLAHDLDLAKRLLAEAGFPGGESFPTDLEYLFNSSPLNKNIAVELQRMWRETLGIQVKLRQAEHKVYLAAQSALDYHVTRSSWIGDYNDPNTFLDMFMTQNGNNRTGWSSADYDRLIRLANATTDPAKRNELFRQAETILIADELPILPIFFYVGINIYNPNRIGGIHPNILDIHPISAIYAKKASSAAK